MGTRSSSPWRAGCVSKKNLPGSDVCPPKKTRASKSLKSLIRASEQVAEGPVKIEAVSDQVAEVADASKRASR